MKKTLITLVAMLLASTAFAQEGTRLASALGGLAGNIIGTVIVDVAGAAKCGAGVAVDRAITGRGRDAAYGRLIDASNYDQCRRQAESDQREQLRQRQWQQERLAEEYRREVMYAREEARRNAPQCDYYERDGQASRACAERVYGAWRR